jgi:predicted ATPase/DNA-binding CsgD family transcriptional regulator
VQRRVSSPDFVGRGPELTALLAALDRAAEGRFAAILLAGESGVGKTRLLAALDLAAEARGARVLGGDCVTLAEGELPYAPVRSALRRLVDELAPDEVDALLGPSRDELGRLLPGFDVAGSVPAEPAGGVPLAQARLFELLLRMLAQLGRDAPVVLAIEDIHWADPSTLDFLAFLMSNARRERLMLVCSYRTDDVHRGHPLRSFLAEHARRPTVERMELQLFTREELSWQLEGILGAQPEAGLVSRLHERTGGNAFFTEELLAASEQGTELPASLRDALLLRIEALPERTQEVLRVAAAHGRVVTHRLLAAVCELPEDVLHESLREAVTHHVLVHDEEESYAFRHALLQETLEADLLPGERARLHVALAEALDGDPALVSREGRAAAEVCAHWLAAQRLPEALGTALRAGVEAEEVCAFADASRHFERVLELWALVDDAEGRTGMDEGAVYARAAEAAHFSGDGTGAIRMAKGAIQSVDARADPKRAAVLRAELGVYLYRATGDTEAAQHAYEGALELLPADEPCPELARVLAALARILMLKGRTRESIERSERAIAVARQVGARADEAHALNTLGVNLASLGDRETGIRHLREAQRITEEVGDVSHLAAAYLNLSDALHQDCRVAESAEMALAGARRCVQLGLREARLLLEAEAASRLGQLGRLDEADLLTETALELVPSIGAYNQCASRARLEVERGRVSEAAGLVAASDDSMSKIPGATWVEPLASARVELELLRDRPEDARRVGARTLEASAGHEKVFYTARLHAATARAEAVLAERARAAGDEPAAAGAAGRAAALLERMQTLLDADDWRGELPPEALARRDVCAAEAKRAAGTASASDWAAVGKHWNELGFPLDEAYARLREAECLVLAGERGGAEKAVVAGLRITREAGAAWLQEQLEALARRGRLAGVRDGEGDGAVASDEAVDRLGLTERELAVLALLALGKTNRQIGQELFMAEKTASVHVSRILAKLGVSSRVEAATAAQRLGIVG